MSVAPLLDTHIWVWWIDRDPRLDPETIAALDLLPGDRRPYLSAISLWEVAILVDLGRLFLPARLSAWLADAAHPRSVRLLPITPVIAAGVATLPPTFHRDPADRLIVATCREMDLPIVTRDRLILRSRLVPRWRPDTHG